MKQISAFLVNNPLAALPTMLAGIAIVLLALPALAPVSSWIGVGAGLLVLGTVGLWELSWSHTQRRFDALLAENSALNDTLAPLTVEGADEATAALNDTLQAQRILAIFPANRGLVHQLRVESEKTHYAESERDDLRTFFTEFAHARFDNGRIHIAFMDVFRSARSLDDWVTAQTSKTDSSWTLTPGDARPGGWQEFAQAKAKGEVLAGEFLGRRDNFIRIAREQEILAPYVDAPQTDSTPAPDPNFDSAESVDK